MKLKEWLEFKKELRNLNTQCSVCLEPAGIHGSTNGHCPRGNATFFKPYKDMRNMCGSPQRTATGEKE